MMGPVAADFWKVASQERDRTRSLPVSELVEATGISVVGEFYSALGTKVENNSSPSDSDC